MMTPFDPQKIDLRGINIIEASAGTGKTYTLAELYLRLITEKNLSVDQILVVTYTRAATEELRERLRARLRLARDHLLLQDGIDVHQHQRLQLAIECFDQATIFTIHGFCQRILSDFAFESGVDFERHLVTDESALLQQLVDDYWRQNLTDIPSHFAAFIVQQRQTPDTLLRSIRSLIAKPYLHLRPVPEVDIEASAKRAQQQFEKVKTLWHQDYELIYQTLTDKKRLNGNRYRSNTVTKLLQDAQALMITPQVPNQLFDGFERLTTAKLTEALKKDQTLPESIFWSACDQLVDTVHSLEQTLETLFQSHRLAALKWIQQQLPLAKQRLQVQSYDDLLQNVAYALSGKNGYSLARKLAKQFPAALIDEFQDTDPIQYQSFQAIYQQTDLPVFLIGDPKQAIYRFRGADIFTYLEAKQDADNLFTLTQNWRSHPRLVSAINQLFQRQSNPFLIESIPFIPVTPAREDREIAKIDDLTAPLTLFFLDHNEVKNKQDMSLDSAGACADRIAQLLQKGEQGHAGFITDDDQRLRPLSGGDIAILVTTHRQAHTIQQSLQIRGINSVQQGRENVFQSEQAQLLKRLMQAMIHPEELRYLISALATDLWSFTYRELEQLQQDDSAIEKYSPLFYHCQQTWIKHGFMPAFRQLLAQVRGQQQLLSFNTGERKLTNLLHLAELVAAYDQNHQGHINTTFQWLTEKIRSTDTQDETHQLRLETDQQLVKIITIHKSKGLEFPIVFCPFLWDSLTSSAQDIVSFHDPENHYQPTVAFTEPALTEAKQVELSEQRAEALRLLYVALTRAKEHCILCWGPVKGMEQSALFSLLHPNGDEEAPDYLEDLNELAKKSHHTIAIEKLNTERPHHHYTDKNENHALKAKVFQGAIYQPWRIGSFSSLSFGHDAELPDHDHQTSDSKLVSDLSEVIIDQGRFRFPRGPQAGSCLHAILEQLDFDQSDSEMSNGLIHRILRQYGFADHWRNTVRDWLGEILTTKLDNDTAVTLSQLKRTERIDEMSFYLPVASLTLARLKQNLLPLIAPDSDLAQVITTLTFSDLTGFMKGFIDLVFYHQGRYYVVDYKSNYLGSEREDYNPESLSQAMIAHDYPLQYLIYSLALHRHLQLRLPDYDPEQHLGGIYYLFIRGMHPNWEQSGVYYRSLNKELLMAFDQCLNEID